jgi:hypothetical protein
MAVVVRVVLLQVNLGWKGYAGGVVWFSMGGDWGEALGVWVG